jgi:hypothetical protein
MKKLFFGLAFLGSVLLINGNAKAQESEPGEGGGGSGQKICCQLTGAFCQDKYGNAYADSIEKPGPYCP